jgi:Ca2+-binding EF-hand superfamily protein
MRRALLGPTILLATTAAAVRAQALPPAAARQSPPIPAAKSSTQTGPRPKEGRKVSLDRYSESTSRRAFSACDENADDRLDLFEAAAAIEAIGSPRDRNAFRRMDRDRDGFLGFLEFDALFRSVVQRGDAFRIRVCRPYHAESATRVVENKASAEERLLQLFDADRSGNLNLAELATLLKGTTYETSQTRALEMIDRDQSGAVDAHELQFMLKYLGPGLQTVRPPLDPGKPKDNLPEPWASIDTDRNGRVDQRDLEASLRALDPALTRWARQILKVADTNQDGEVTAEELANSTTAAGKPIGADPPRR